MAGLEAELAEEQSRRHEAEYRAQTAQRRRQEAERRATHLAREKQEAERNKQILRSEKAGNNDSYEFIYTTDYSTAIIEESERRQSELGEQVREATQRAVQAENRARDGERQVSEANNRVRELEGEMGQLQDQLQESGAAVREREERLGKVEGRLAEMEREGERRRKQAEERVRTAVERQRGAEERMIEAEDSRQQVDEIAQRRVQQAEERAQQAEQFALRCMQQAEQMQQEAEQLAVCRTQQAENRLREETQQRIHCERQIEQLERAAQGEEVLWRVERREIHLSQRELGRGGWAAVKVAEFRGLQVAAKCLHSIIISEHNRQLFQREMDIAARLRHPHLVQFIGATLEGEPVILTELMSSSLRDILERGGLREAQITTISRHVALALTYMHQITPDPILHRDVSSANVLLNPAAPEGAWVAKLSDYGSANFTRLVSTAGPGNPSYAAPEASNPAQQSPKMDVFSFGVLLLEVATGQFPNRDNLAVQMRGITLPKLQQLVRRCINDNPTRRPSINIVLEQL